MSTWYYAGPQGQLGPLTEEEFQKHVTNGNILPETLVWKQGMKDWRPFKEIRPVSLNLAPPSLHNVHYAGFWVRVVASIIDGVIMKGSIFILAFFFGAPLLMSPSISIHSLSSQIFSGGFSFIAMVLYETLCVGKWGATPGKMFLRLKIVNQDGTPVDYLKSFARHFAKYLSGMILLIGYIMVAFDSEKKGLHDYICGTRVITK